MSAYIVIVGRQFPDRDDVALWGPFDSENEAQEFIESATDEDVNEPHLMLDDVDYAEVMFVNRGRP